MKGSRVLWVTAVVVIAVGCSKAERTTTAQRERGTAVGTAGTAAKDAKSNEDFVHDVALINLTGIELSRMALAKDASPELKVFAQTMIDEHGGANDKLKNAIGGTQIGLPTQLDEKHKKPVHELANKQGADFERGYTEAMVHVQQDLGAKLESRLDLETVANWKAAAAGRTQSKALPEPKAEMGDVAVRPEKSVDTLTMKINQWAADTFPGTQKELDTARTLENTTKKGSSN
jgi:putative membrane protein